MVNKLKTKNTSKVKGTKTKVTKATAIQKPVVKIDPSTIVAGIKDQLVSFHHTLEDALKSDKPNRYVMAKNGVVEVRSNRIGTFIAKTTEVPGAEELKESFRFNLPNKVPYDFFLQILSFFRAVNDEFGGAEAALQVFWNEDKQEYFIHCPEQEVSGATVNFKRDPELEAEHLLILDIHSHNTMGAFFSATDNSDEKETRLFGVVGKITNATPEYKFRAMCGGKAIELDIWDVFQNPFEPTDHPKEWMDKVSKYNPPAIKRVSTAYAGKTKKRGSVGSSYSLFNGFDDELYGEEYYSNYYSKYYPEMETAVDDHLEILDPDEVRYEQVEEIIQNLDDDAIELLISRLADEGYDGIIEGALYNKK